MCATPMKATLIFLSLCAKADGTVAAIAAAEAVWINWRRDKVEFIGRWFKGDFASRQASRGVHCAGNCCARGRAQSTWLSSRLTPAVQFAAIQSEAALSSHQ